MTVDAFILLLMLVVLACRWMIAKLKKLQKAHWYKKNKIQDLIVAKHEALKRDDNTDDIVLRVNNLCDGIRRKYPLISHEHVTSGFEIRTYRKKYYHGHHYKYRKKY